MDADIKVRCFRPFFLDTKHVWPYPRRPAGFFIPRSEDNVEKRLTQKKRDLALAYLKTGNATAAYYAAYPDFAGKRKTATEKASRILNEPDVQEYLESLRQKIAAPQIMTLRELGQFWTTVIKQPLNTTADRLLASRTLAQYAVKVFENKQTQSAPQEPAPRPAKTADFASFCVAAGYPRPYPKQCEMAELVRREGPRLLLGARGYGKTDYSVICNVAWALLQNPADTWLILTKEKERGAEILGEISRILKENGAVLAKDSTRRLVLQGHKDKDPNVAALPLRSRSFRGRHPKHIVCDDLITPDDVSKAERDKVEAVREELMKLTPNVIFIGQPAHAKDVYAKIRHLPGVEKMEVPYGSIPQLDADLEAQRAAGISEESIQASYFLRISETERIPFAGLQTVEFFPSGGCAGFVDPSHEGADYTAMAIGAMNFDNFVVAGFAWPKAWDDCVEDIGRVCMAYNVAKFAFETNGVGKHPVVMFRRNGANVAEWRSDTNKHGRILNAASFKGHLKLASYLPPALSTPAFRQAQQTFNNMVLEYEYKAEHDDAPDALANLMMYLGLVKK